MPASRQTASAPFADSDDAPLTIVEPPHGTREEAKHPPASRGPNIRLFWRTFLLLGALLLGNALGSYLVLGALEFRPGV
ncbi:MAG: hypothetical protein IKH84_02135, partial [Ottowia sp.]|nr:hypothetical protein [Ottowia sp.]